MPSGDPPPGYRYRVVEIPLDQVFAESMTNFSTPLTSEIGSEPSGSDESDALLEQLIQEQMYDSRHVDPLLKEELLHHFERQRLLKQRLQEQQEQTPWLAPPPETGIPPADVEECPITPEPSSALEVAPQAEAKLPQSLTTSRSPEAIKEEEEMKEMIREMNEQQEPLAGVLMALLPAFLLLLLFIPIGIFVFVKRETVTVVECPFRSCVEDARRFDDIVEHATVSACVDFYEHTCAYWREANPIPDYAWRHSYMDRIRMNIEADVRDALKENPEKGRKTMSDLDLALFHGNNHLVSQALTQLVLQFDVDAFFRVRFLRSQFAYPREYLKEADRRLLHEATLEVYDALCLHPAPERRARAEKVVDVVKAVTTRILNLRATAVNNPVAFRKVSDFGGAKVPSSKFVVTFVRIRFQVDWHTFFSEVTHHSMPQLRFTMVKLVNSYYLLDISQFIDSLAEHAGDTVALADYLRLLLFLHFATALPSLSKITEAYWRFAHDLRQEPERWRLCLYFIDDVLPRSLSWFYHHYHLTLRVAKEGSVADHLSTVTALKEVFAMFLANTAAAPFNMRADGATKLENMNVVMFFVPNLVEGDVIHIPPPTIDVDPSNIVLAAIEARRVEVATYYNFSSFLEKGKQFGPPYKVFDLNCRYNYDTNTLYVPHALFHGSLYEEGERNLVYLPKLLHVIGTGVGKALDPRGVHTSSEAEDADWLWGESLQRWENSTACFRTVYNVIDPKTRRKVDPVRTFPGNFVDSMALQAALWYMCEALKPAAFNKVLDFGLLPPNHVRLNTLLRNTPEFAAAFKCPSTSQMVLPTADYCVAFPRRERDIVKPIDAYAMPRPAVLPV
ncbi:hypothetical protein MRX96_046081 [Rhipicephalus microplus]